MSKENVTPNDGVNRAKLYQLALFPMNNGATNVYFVLILSYITYMVKVNVAQLVTQRNFLKNSANYSKILGVLSSRINQFKGADGRLENVVVTAPSFSSLPEAAGDTIIVPNAWSATYVDNVRKVTITGTLYIGA